MSRVTQKPRRARDGPEKAAKTERPASSTPPQKHVRGHRLSPGDPALEWEADRYADGAPLIPGRAPKSRRAGGEKLPDPLRRQHEERLGRSLDDLRLHHDGGAAAEAADLGARAFAEDGDIVFAAGRFRPDSADGQALIAHEVAHAAQQADGRGTGPALQGDSLTLRPNVPPPVVHRGDNGRISASVFFAQGEFLLGARGVDALAGLRRQLAGMVAGARVIVDAHASGEGAADVNHALSEHRLSAVRALLGPAVGPNVTIEAAAHGEDRAAATESGAEGAALADRRARNRRVDITILPTWTISPDPERGEGSAQPVDLSPRSLDPRLLDPSTLDPGSFGPRVQPGPDLMRPLPQVPGREPVSVCGVWQDATQTWFDRRLRDLGVGEGLRGTLTDLGVGAVEKLAFTAIEEAVGAAGASGRDQRIIMHVVRGACQQEFRP